jgi:hypothetical protein
MGSDAMNGKARARTGMHVAVIKVDHNCKDGVQFTKVGPDCKGNVQFIGYGTILKSNQLLGIPRRGETLKVHEPVIKTVRHGKVTTVHGQQYFWMRRADYKVCLSILRGHERQA